ncbi:MAG: signal peptidase I [Pirellulales bacterium]|nr:signal peptidase I [Pirellulales bacterium]
MARKTPKQSEPEAESVDDHPAILAPGGRQFHAIREVIESVAVAFVLAFMFRTFVAEAFVIPTGSMSPALQGRHKDVRCDQCDYRFQVTASSEDPEDMPPRYARNPELAQTVGGMCPMCRRLMPFRADLRPELLEAAGTKDPAFQRTYPGDRIVVDKFGLDFSEPERWDVVVFKYPGDGNMNYIKRLTGLPGDKLKITQGDLFVQSPGSSAFEITRRPPEIVRAMLQGVHDTDFEPSVLAKAGWPLRWAPTTPAGWRHEVDVAERNVVQSFAIDSASGQGEPAWIRYRHLVPNEDVWELVLGAGDRELTAAERDALEPSKRPELISDFNPYNARLQRDVANRLGWQVMPPSQPPQDGVTGSTGYEWVGDLALECRVEVREAQGELLLDLVEAGYHFRATVTLDTGAVACSIVDGRTGEPLDFQATGQCRVKSPGTYRLRFANVDDRLWLWVDDKLVDLEGATWDPDELLGGRQSLLPWADEGPAGDQGDLAPAGVGARGASLAITRLAVLRDIYYVAAKHERGQPNQGALDYPHFTFEMRLPDGTRVPAVDSVPALMSRRDAWSRFALRRTVDFAVGEDQFFVMGDNSPESLDARLWTDPRGRNGEPGGHYVDRRLLIGKALAVFWPHSWGAIPGLPMLPGWPNFGDMRLVR